MFRRKQTYKCDWLALHFASAERAAGFYNALRETEDANIRRYFGAGDTLRLLKGGERIPLCKE